MGSQLNSEGYPKKKLSRAQEMGPYFHNNSGNHQLSSVLLPEKGQPHPN